MTKVRRLLGLGAFIAVVALVSAYSQGQSGGKKGTKTDTSPQQTPAVGLLQKVEAESGASRFAQAGVLTYQPVQGDVVFALQVKHDLAAKRRPRDILIMLSTTANMAGHGWIGARQITDGIVGSAGADDKVSIWVANDAKATAALTKEFVYAKDKVEAKALQTILNTLRDKTYPTGVGEIKDALTRAIETFPTKLDNRQRILLYLGDGNSMDNPPLTADDRAALARQMAAKQIGFFAVPLGSNLNPETLHGLANGSGGTILRTAVTSEKLTDALKRYDEAFDGTILYAPKLSYPANVAATDTFPAELPPLRSDVPTLVVGKMKPADALAYTIAATLPGKSGEQVKRTITEAVKAADLDNSFLVGMQQQWRKAKDRPALLRADRALAFAYEQTKLQQQELLLSAQIAIERDNLDAAARFYQEVRQLSPHDTEANAGVAILDKLKKGEITLEKLKKNMEKKGNGKADMAQFDKASGKVRWNTILLAQKDDKDAPKEKKGNPVPVKNPKDEAVEDFLQAHRDRVIVEEQKINQAVEDALRRARRDLASDPETVLESLRNLLARVKDHPDVGENVRNALVTRLQTTLVQSTNEARNLRLNKANQQAAVDLIKRNIEREQQKLSFEERVEAQFRAFRVQMNEARHEAAAMREMLNGMVAMQEEARTKGMPIPVATQAAYTITQSAFHLNQYEDLRRRRQDGFLSVMLSIEKSHVPYADEPGIYFPPLKTWKALEKLRKDKYLVQSLPDDPAGRKEAKAIDDMLKEPIETKDFKDDMPLKTAIALIGEKFGAKGKELAIVVDTAAFKNDDMKDPYDATVKLQPVPRQMTLGTALRLMLAQVPVENDAATYIIRRNFLEITTETIALKDRVLRVYPVGDLVIPISQQLGAVGAAGAVGQFGGGQFGNRGGQFGQFGGGQFGGGQFGQFGGGGFGQFGGGQFGGGGFGQFGGGGFGQFGGGQFGGGGFGQFGGGGFGQFGGGQFGGGQFGQFGNRGGQFGGGQFGQNFGGGAGGNFTGGSFQGGFNGALGALGASQAFSLIRLIERVVPGKWNVPDQPLPFAPMLAPGLGVIGMGGAAGMNGMFGAGPPGQPGAPNPFDQDANTIEFFPSALALIVRAPSRIHYSPFGGVVGRGARKEQAVQNELKKPGLDVALKEKFKIDIARNNKKNPKIGPKEEADPAQVWQDALARGADPGIVIAVADFLFEAGEYTHAREFLKAVIRNGIVTRPWVYESLAIALEASGGSSDKVRRARLSAVALDPNDAQGFLNAARTMSDQKDYARALGFCRQAAHLEPGQAQPFADALAYAELSKDAKGMEWAVGKLLAQDWATDNVALHRAAETRASALADALKKEQRGTESDKLRAALRELTRRDLKVTLTWEYSNPNTPSEVELLVKEPSGSVGTHDQRQTAGGGTMIPFDALTDKGTPTSTYAAALAFKGDYEITVRRVWGQPYGNRAKLEIVENFGTPQQRKRLEIIDLTQGKTVKLSLAAGRRTELAVVSPTPPKRTEATEADKAASPFQKLRSMAMPDYAGAKVTGGIGGAGSRVPLPSVRPSKLAQREKDNGPMLQGAITSGSGLNLTTQVRQDADTREFNLVMQPVFQANDRGSRPPVNLSFIPGGN